MARRPTPLSLSLWKFLSLIQAAWLATGCTGAQETGKYFEQRTSKRFHNADRGQRWVGLFVLLMGLGTATTSWSGDDHLVQCMLAGGEVLLIRRAAAPGTGDPEGFRLADCATRRNLSDTGRKQARAIGEFTASGHAVLAALGQGGALRTPGRIGFSE